MPLSWSHIKFFLFLLITTKAQDYIDEELPSSLTEELLAELTLVNLELQDDCEAVGNALKSALISNTFNEKRAALKNHGVFLNNQSSHLKSYDNNALSWNFQRNWNLIVNPGDELLSNDDWNTLITYDIDNEELVHTVTVNCANRSTNCLHIKKGYDDIIQTSRNQTLLRKSWQAWQSVLSLRKPQYVKVLNLVSKAAALNGQTGPRAYWEMLVDQANAYESAETLWQQIEPFYLKLHKFVRDRLFRFYEIDNAEKTIPAYLLGTNFGSDWSHVADLVLPHPQLHHDAQTFLRTAAIEDLYKMAEAVTKELSLGALGDKFWRNSLFNMTFCESHVVSFCAQEHSEVFACDKVSWVTYLDAFDTALDVALRNKDYFDFSVWNLRYSVLDEAVKALGPVLAVKNLNFGGIVERNFTEDDRMTSLLLVALRVLPKLPFYLAADTWRLDLLENGYNGMEAKWWKLRNELQGVKGIFNNETDYLGDHYLTSNRPYLSKFLGTILQFQLLDHYKTSWDDQDENIAPIFGADENFASKIFEERIEKDWQTLMSEYFYIDDISADSLLNYFAPLNDYLDSAPLEQQKIDISKPIEKKVKLDKLQVVPSSTTESHPVIVHHTVGPEPHRHFHEDLQEGNNPAMEKISMWVGIGLLGGAVMVVAFAVAAKKLKKKKTNNRRFET